MTSLKYDITPQSNNLFPSIPAREYSSSSHIPNQSITGRDSGSSSAISFIGYTLLHGILAPYFGKFLKGFDNYATNAFNKLNVEFIILPGAVLQYAAQSYLLPKIYDYFGIDSNESSKVMQSIIVQKQNVGTSNINDDQQCSHYHEYHAMHQKSDICLAEDHSE